MGIDYYTWKYFVFNLHTHPERTGGSRPTFTVVNSNLKYAPPKLNSWHILFSLSGQDFPMDSIRNIFPKKDWKFNVWRNRILNEFRFRQYLNNFSNNLQLSVQNFTVTSKVVCPVDINEPGMKSKHISSRCFNLFRYFQFFWFTEKIYINKKYKMQNN